MKTTLEAEREPESTEASAPAEVAPADRGFSGEGSAGLAPAENGPPPSTEPTSSERVERDIDELRRFRVRTVPPEMRRQWLLAEVPVVSTLELQDTAPPNQSGMVAPPAPISTRASLSAVTRRLSRVPRRSERSSIAFVAVASVVIVGAGSIAFVLSGPKATPKTEAAESLRGTRLAETEPSRGLAVPEHASERTIANGSAVEPPIIAPVATSRASAESSAAVVPSPASVSARTVARHALPNERGVKPAPSGKSASEKSKLDSDIKAPLFEK